MIDHDALVSHNRDAWDHEVESGNIWTVPVTPEETARARAGDWQLLLTPAKPVPANWFPEVRDLRVLCLACGGGQQGPILAAAGARVTVFDNSPAQLARDREVAARDGLPIRLEQGDMRDLSRFQDDSFDLVFHPVSNCFIDDVLPVWRECFRVLRRGGTLLAGFCNPVSFIASNEDWWRDGTVSIRYRIPYSDVDQLPPEILADRVARMEPLEYGHSLSAQIGGQLSAGFHLVGLYEDSDPVYQGPLDANIEPFLATKAVKP